MRTNLIIAAISFLLAGVSFAESPIEIRDRWSKEIGAVVRGECADETEAVRKELNYAASLVAHGEFGEAMMALKSSRESASSEICQSAIKTASRPSKK